MQVENITFKTKHPFICPACNCHFGQPQAIRFYGVVLLADCLCECCEKTYTHSLPTGHAGLFPFSFTANYDKVKVDPKANWFTNPILHNLKQNQKSSALVKVKNHTAKKEVVLLNTLDTCYGHVLFKLLNLSLIRQQNPNQAVVVVLPASFEWLVPQYPDVELWLVDERLSKLNQEVVSLQPVFEAERKRFDSITLHPAYIHPDTSAIQLQDYFKTAPFELRKFEHKPYQITFLTREDRLWTSSRLASFFFLASISKPFLKGLQPFFCWRQKRQFQQLAKAIQRKVNKPIQFNLVGMGTSGKYSASFKDLRKDKLTPADELQWNETFSKSHLVIGIHGSNMLIPSALAAGFIELVPRYKIDHLVEDSLMHHPARYAQFLGRYLDECSSIDLIATHAASMLEVFPFIRSNCEL